MQNLNLVSAMSADANILIHAMDSREIVQEIRRFHGTSATMSAALGRLATASALIGSMQKNERCSVTLRIKGGGPAGTLTAICDPGGKVRASCTNPRADLPTNPANGKLNVGGVVGKDGTLTVIRDDGAGEPYTGVSELVSGEIAQDICAYFAVSEQIPSVCALGVLVDTDLSIKSAGGYLLQLMPQAGDREISVIEDNVAMLESVTTLLDRGITPEEIIGSVLQGFSPKIVGRSSAVYACNCSLRKMQGILATLGQDDLNELALSQETEVVCSYCDQKYLFSPEELLSLRGMFAQSKAEKSE